eukprot:8287937-Alexandrium_andersonii.AAC.1
MASWPHGLMASWPHSSTIVTIHIRWSSGCLTSCLQVRRCSLLRVAWSVVLLAMCVLLYSDA